MKNLIITFTFLLITSNVIAQSDEIKAKSEYFAAEEEYNNDNYQQCIAHLNTTESLLGSTNTRILYLKIKAYCNLEEYSKAYEAQKKYFELATDPDDPKFNEIVRLLSKINKYAASEFFEKANKSYKNGNYDKAIETYKKAIEIRPDYANAYFNMGLSYVKKGNYDKVIEAYKKCIEYEPENARAYYLIGWSYGNKGNYDKAIEAYKKAIEIKPDNANAYYYIGKTNYIDLGKTEESKYYFNKVIELGEDNSIITIYSVFFLGNEEESIRRMNNRLKEAKESNDSEKIKGEYYNFACLFSLVNKPEKALEYFTLALENGYDNFGHIKQDSDLDNIRNKPEFKTLIEKYKD